MITRHNYEEYFLLYLDRELDAATCRQVEAFAAQHPDLKEGLEMLKQTRFEPDTTIGFTGKHSLLKTAEDSPVHAGNYEEWFLLYADNELTAAQKQDVETWVAQHPSYAAELQVLCRVHLEPDLNIVFPDKQSLYRREETRVRPIIWRRIAVAACLILAIGTGTWMLIRDEEQANDGGMATNQPAQKPDSGKNRFTPKNISGSASAETPEEIIASVDNHGLNQQKSGTDNSSIQETKRNAAIENVVNNSKTTDETTTAANTSITTGSNTFTEDEAAEFVRPQVPQNTPLTFSKEIKPVAAVTPSNIQPLDNRIANGPMTDEEDAEPAKKSSRLRGFFRKVTRTFEKNTHIKATDSDDRLLIGGVAIRL